MTYSTDIERLNYYEGEFLGAADFEAEQEYHRDMRRRHNIGQHTWGIVSGLDLVQIPNGGTANGSPAVDIYVQPGMAIDGFGREIVVLNKTQLTQDLFAPYVNANTPGPQTMYIWISYAQLMLQPPSDPCVQMNQPNAFVRVQEAYALTAWPDQNGPTDDQIVVDGKSMAPPVQPDSTPPPPAPQPGDVILPYDDSVPYQEFSTDDSSLSWYILIGQVAWDPNTGLFEQRPDSVAATGREYAGNITAAIYSPGSSLAIRNRFAPLSLPKDPSDPTSGQYYGGVSVEVVGSLKVDRLLEAAQNVLIDGVADPSNPKLSPLTIGPSGTDQNLVQFRDTNGKAKWGICENLGGATPGLNIGEADSSGTLPGSSRFFIQPGGNVGIGLTNPQQNLSVNGGLNLDQANQNKGGALDPGLSFGAGSGGASSGEGIASNQSGGGKNPGGLDFYTSGNLQMSITQGGGVGLGTQTPAATLDVASGLIHVGNNPTPTVSQPGGYLGWNALTKNTGETDFINNQGPSPATGGFAFMNAPAAGSPISTLMVITGGGNVGIQTTSPIASLDIGSGLLHIAGTTTPSTPSQGAYIGWNALTGGTGETDFINNQGWGTGGFAFMNTPLSGAPRTTLMVITGTGNVGIGTQAPGTTLDVNGTARASGSIAGGETSTGWVLGKGAWGPDNWLRLTTTEGGGVYHDFAVNSFWAAGTQRFDLAEVTPARPADALEQGDVVVIDRECGMQVTRSSKAFDTSVYGIVSSYEQASMVIGGFGGPETVKGDAGKLPIALVGRAKAKATAENGPIQVGDLLTTSSTPGHVMRCGSSRCLGSIVGKALEALDDAVGIITIRVALS